MNVRHFYHLAAGVTWEDVAEEHATALEDAQWPWPVTVGLVGDAESRTIARKWFASRLGVTDFTEADRGWEDVTLRALRDWALQNPDGAVLYAHAKGTFTRHPLNDAWRRGMTARVVADWQFCLEWLADVDAVGCHWLTPGQYGYRGVTRPFFGGNFWWARCSYIAALAEPAGTEDRYESEAWLGTGHPQVHDLKPGWPTYPIY